MQLKKVLNKNKTNKNCFYFVLRLFCFACVILFCFCVYFVFAFILFYFVCVILFYFARVHFY